MNINWSKKHILTQIEKLNEAEYVCYIWKKDSKETHTRQQQKTWYKIIGGISKHLWYTLQEVKLYLLAWCFGTRPLKLGRTEIQIPNKSKTSELDKKEWIFFIDTILEFCKAKNIPITITSREVTELYKTYDKDYDWY